MSDEQAMGWVLLAIAITLLIISGVLIAEAIQTIRGGGA